jgi:hypothetical protein
MRLLPNWLPVFLFVAACSRSLACITVDVEVIATANELRDSFAASAQVSPNSVEVSLKSTVNWVNFGKFRSYTLKVLPVEVTAANVASEHWKYGSDSVVTNIETPIARFSLEKDKISRAYVVVHFEGTLMRSADLIDVCIPFSAFQLLIEKRLNPPPVPTAPSFRALP